MNIDKLKELAELYGFKFAANEQEKLKLIEEGYETVNIDFENPICESKILITQLEGSQITVESIKEKTIYTSVKTKYTSDFSLTISNNFPLVA